MKNKMKKVRVAIIGLGYWGPNILRNFAQIPNVEVVYGCDLANDNLKKFSIIYPLVKFTSNYNLILKDKSIDLVAIATPLSTHYELARRALGDNKHVLIEKPMTTTSKEAQDLIRIAKTNNKIIMVGFTFVYSEAVRKIKQLIDKNELGKPYYYDSTRINSGILQKDMNVIWDLACHDLSIINFLFPHKPISIQAFGSRFLNKKLDEIAYLVISYEDNFTAHINVSWLSPVKIRSTLICGSKKMVNYDDISPNEKIKIFDKTITYSASKITPFSPAYRSGDIIIPYLDQTESLLNELNHLIDCIKTNKKPLTSGEEGLKILKLLEASDLSLKIKSEVKL